MKPFFCNSTLLLEKMLESEQGILPERVAIVLGDNKIKHLGLRLL